ncbi:N-acetylmuramoyl-L-alanine amidase [Streptomyces zingiberis]|uniref:N-acetylmuramoyl-L-alanine amidase n=1 Tax=Streptomyces zingiberis TaxID=2053010 RepID=A0ABX1BXU1_9ACTN|nr:N-acetylmuramoyl-L-alanine amidase [Streptomyces zingiberis]NJQ00312.1 nucleoside transporter [Streptomyces zingiberis]
MNSPRPALPRTRRLTALIGTAVAASLLLAGQPASAAPDPSGAATGSGPVGAAFASAAAEYDVPRDLLVAVGYGETHLDGHRGEPSHANGYGVMHLVSNPSNRTLERAARITGEEVADLRRDTAVNIRGGAAVLRALADDLGLDAADRDRLGAWYPVTARYGGSGSDAAARLYADTVYELLADGISAHAGGGELVHAAPRKATPERGEYAGAGVTGETGPAGAQSPDYGPAQWVPASTANYATGRSQSISAVVVHVTQGSYAGTISWFQNPASQVSAHYVVRSSDGQVTQMVRDRDTAWHARSGNAYSVGIEHEGWVNDPSWFTDAMYRSSAALTRHLADTYGIPKDRAHIVGHHEVPGNDHTDPGPNWNWTYYMQLVRGDSGGATTSFPTWGTDVNIRKSPSTGAARVATLAGPTTVRVRCQVRGEKVTYQGYTNDAWAYLPDYGGYLSNIFVDVADSWLPGVPTC